MKVGFYHPKERIMYAVEPWTFSVFQIEGTAVKLGEIYRSGMHWMPSPFWCVWGHPDVKRIFSLSREPLPDFAFEHIQTLMV